MAYLSPEQVLPQYVTQAYRTLNPVVPSHGVFGSESPDVELPRLAKAYNRENGLQQAIIVPMRAHAFTAELHLDC